MQDNRHNCSIFSGDISQDPNDQSEVTQSPCLRSKGIKKDKEND